MYSKEELEAETKESLTLIITVLDKALEQWQDQKEVWPLPTYPISTCGHT